MVMGEVCVNIYLRISYVGLGEVQSHVLIRRLLMVRSKGTGRQFQRGSTRILGTGGVRILILVLVALGSAKVRLIHMFINGQ